MDMFSGMFSNNKYFTEGILICKTHSVDFFGEQHMLIVWFPSQTSTPPSGDSSNKGRRL